MTILHWRSWHPSRCSVHKAGCLSIPHLMPKDYRFPGMTLVRSDSWKDGNAGPSISEGIRNNRMNQLGCKRQAMGEATQNLISTMSLFHLGCYQLALLGVDLPTSVQSGQVLHWGDSNIWQVTLKPTIALCLLGDSKSCQVDNDNCR